MERKKCPLLKWRRRPQRAKCPFQTWPPCPLCTLFQNGVFSFLTSPLPTWPHEPRYAHFQDGGRETHHSQNGRRAALRRARPDPRWRGRLRGRRSVAQNDRRPPARHGGAGRRRRTRRSAPLRLPPSLRLPRSPPRGHAGSGREEDERPRRGGRARLPLASPRLGEPAPAAGGGAGRAGERGGGGWGFAQHPCQVDVPSGRGNSVEGDSGVHLPSPAGAQHPCPVGRPSGLWAASWLWGGGIPLHSYKVSQSLRLWGWGCLLAFDPHPQHPCQVGQPLRAVG